jgi:hypothetical protein
MQHATSLQKEDLKKKKLGSECTVRDNITVPWYIFHSSIDPLGDADPEIISILGSGNLCIGNSHNTLSLLATSDSTISFLAGFSCGVVAVAVTAAVILVMPESSVTEVAGGEDGGGVTIVNAASLVLKTAWSAVSGNLLCSGCECCVRGKDGRKALILSPSFALLLLRIIIGGRGRSRTPGISESMRGIVWGAPSPVTWPDGYSAAYYPRV